MMSFMSFKKNFWDNKPFLSISSCNNFSISSSSAMSIARSPSLLTAATFAPFFKRYLENEEKLDPREGVGLLTI